VACVLVVPPTACTSTVLLKALLSDQGRIRALAGVAPSLYAPVLYWVYLYHETGRWSAWSDANQAGWNLHYVVPVQSLKTSWWGAFKHP
jgi:hypothetical protein